MKIGSLQQTPHNKIGINKNYESDGIEEIKRKNGIIIRGDEEKSEKKKRAKGKYI